MLFPYMVFYYSPLNLDQLQLDFDVEYLIYSYFEVYMVLIEFEPCDVKWILLDFPLVE